jgi:hypothetical protein
VKRLAAGVIAILAILAVPATATTHVRLAGCGDKPAYKPKRVIIACGDGAFRVHGLKWSTWTRKTAIGNGTADVLSCNPSCAEGKFKSYPIKLTADRAKACPKNGRQFTRLTYSFKNKKPRGARSTDSLDRPCNG